MSRFCQLFPAPIPDQGTHFYTTPNVEDSTKSESFTYDPWSRLSAAQTGVVNSTAGAKTWSLQWTYDRLGNRLSQTMVGGDPTLPIGQPNFAIDPATNRITISGYTYDAAGNMTHDATAAYMCSQKTFPRLAERCKCGKAKFGC